MYLSDTFSSSLREVLGHERSRVRFSAEEPTTTNSFSAPKEKAVSNKNLLKLLKCPLSCLISSCRKVTNFNTDISKSPFYSYTHFPHHKVVNQTTLLIDFHFHCLLFLRLVSSRITKINQLCVYEKCI